VDGSRFWGFSELRRARGSLTIAEQVILGLLEGVMTVLGFIVVVFPLAVWSVPQQGQSANTIFYIVLTVGSVSFVSLIALTWLKSRLFRGRLPHEAPADGPTGYQAYLTWAEAKDKERQAELQLRSMKSSALQDFGVMARVAALLATVFVLLNLSAWAFTNSYYGDQLFLSAEQRWKLLHPDPWNWD